MKPASNCTTGSSKEVQHEAKHVTTYSAIEGEVALVCHSAGNVFTACYNNCPFVRWLARQRLHRCEEDSSRQHPQYSHS